jgi:hypothetical protein
VRRIELTRAAPNGAVAAATLTALNLDGRVALR